MSSLPGAGHPSVRQNLVGEGGGGGGGGFDMTGCFGGEVLEMLSVAALLSVALWHLRHRGGKEKTKK
jgi:hypothetical protein